MLAALLNKDLRRAARNPVPYLIHLALPLLITGLVGFTFGGGGSEGSRVGQIRIAVVDEDQSPVTEFLRSALQQREAGEYLDARLLAREEALAEITDNQISAVWIIPEGFTEDFLDSKPGVTLELIKNPAQTYYPALVEEGLELLTTGLDAVGRNLRTELPAWRGLLEEEEDFDLLKVGGLLQDAGHRLEAVRPYVYPPLVQYTKKHDEAADAGGADAEESQGPGFSVFAFLLVGMGGMFMLFVADRAVRDLYQELKVHTLERFHTYRESLTVFVVSKVVFAVVILCMTALVIFGGGALLFQFHWKAPLAVALLTLSYACFAAGLMALIASLAAKDRRADLFNTLISMALGLAGGCMFPPQQMPVFLRESIAPWLPTYWFTQAIRNLQHDMPGPPWIIAVLQLAIVGWVTLIAAAWLFRYRLERGLKA